jgi:polyhydroxybutyrate depolymerase
MTNKSLLLSALVLFCMMAACIGTTEQASPLASQPPATQIPASTTLPQTAAPETTATVSAAAAPHVKPGTFAKTIEIEGQPREYILHTPPTYDGSQALPVVIVLHGHGGSDKEMMAATGMNAKADQENFIVIYPNGTGEPRGFNNGILFKPTSNMDDDAFMRTLIENSIQQLHADPRRVYIAGFSNGAGMTYRLGAEFTSQLAAIAIVEGAIGTHQGGSSMVIPQPSSPLPVIIFHGKQDKTIPYDGGTGANNLDYFSVANALAFWNKNNGCTQEPQKQTLDNGNVLTEDFQGCTAGSEVLLYTILSGVHEWPTQQDKAGFSGTDAVWDFFSRHP